MALKQSVKPEIVHSFNKKKNPQRLQIGSQKREKETIALLPLKLYVISVKLTIEQIKVKWTPPSHAHTHPNLPQPLIEGSGEAVNKMMTAGD